MLAKVCPRCGAQYENLKSTTCPQCFAKLLVVDEATAEELSAARAAVEQTPEFQQTKAEDDAKFNEQSFGACFGVVLIALLTLIVGIMLIVAAVRRQHRQHAHPAVAGSRGAPADTSDILTPLPVAAAAPDDLLPLAVGIYSRTEIDDTVTLPGTLTHVQHAAYGPNSRTANSVHLEDQTLDVYVLSTGRPTSEQSAFLAGVAIAAQRGPNPSGHPRLVFATEHWRYAAIGPVSGDGAAPVQFRDALAAGFRRQ